MIRSLKENILKFKNILDNKTIYEISECVDGKYYKIKTSTQFSTAAMGMKCIDLIFMSASNYTVMLNFSGNKIYDIAINLGDGNTIASFLKSEWNKKILGFIRKNRDDIPIWNNFIRELILKYI